MYTRIFREIVEIMHADYAGSLDKAGWDNSQSYEKKIRIGK